MISFLLFFSVTVAQEDFSSSGFKTPVPKTAKEIGHHTHDGLYLSFNLGLNRTFVHSDLQGIYVQDLDGLGSEFSMKLGGAIIENFILHMNLVTKNIKNITISENGAAPVPVRGITLVESIFTGGFTYYLMPENVYISATAGVSTFAMVDLPNVAQTERGVNIYIEVGKEWWISKNWGFGLAGTYTHANISSQSNLGVELIDSNGFSLLFSTTFN